MNFITLSMKFNFYCFHGCGQTPEVFKQLLKNLEKNAITKHKLDCDFHYVKGNFKLKEKGYSWYKEPNKRGGGGYRVDLKTRENKLSKTFSEIKTKTNVMLLGFSEGAMYALDLAMKYSVHKESPIIGVVAIAPPFSPDAIAKYKCHLPGVLIVSDNDFNVSKKESEKWEKHFLNLIKHTNNNSLIGNY